MRSVFVAVVLAALIVAASAIGTEGLAPSAPALTCDVRAIPARYASVETSCTAERFPPNMVVTFLAATITSTTDASGRASATFRISCCFEVPGEFSISATAEDGTTASTTVRVVPGAAEPVRGRATFTG
jgi:hypothetical protein